MQSPDKWRAHLVEAKQHFKNANHLAYVTLTLLKENRLMIKILMDLHKSATSLIKAFLEYESENKQIQLSKDPSKNLQTFLEKVAPKYLESSEIELVSSILKVAKQHKEAPLEFVKRQTFVIYHNGRYETLTQEGLKSLISGLSQVISTFPIKS